VSSDRAGWEELLITTALEVGVIKAALETAGIPVVTQAEASGQIIGLNVGPLGEVRVLVPGDRLLEARELLADSHPLDFPESD
jgi:hypothetical protein